MPHPLHDPRYQRVAALLAQIRRDRGLLQQDVADKLGRPQAYISKVESGVRRLDLIELMDILRVLETDPHLFIDDLLSQTPPAVPR
ncbi:helix-turn-helix domain-containing protein [Paraburkholderia silvatlantica]|uniref:helix-turn-helix domain-containing protein n=1 Tax=Paraburkholderia silvatlantica TaxID=321895 RepID=UPI0037526BE8